MKTAVIGSRNFGDYEMLKKALGERDITQIISGGAKGADTLAKRYAKENDIPLLEFLPEYNKYGRSAPLKRNVLIIDASEVVIAFWDGQSTGTAHSITQARRVGKEVIIISI